MSTEHQQYSTENQADVIQEYAAKRGMEVVRTFADSGKSGLRIDGRDALKELITVVQNGGADFKAKAHVLRDLGHKETQCLISTDDESYTYNHRVNRLVPIQANRMILRAIAAGVPEERLARALNLNVNTIRGGRHLLSDICPEAIEILKDKPVAEAALRAMKRVKPMRQIEMAELMIATGTYTKAYAEGAWSR
jgi:hypothetical protein